MNNFTSEYALGIDIGGTNTAFGVVHNIGDVVFLGNLKTTDYETPSQLFSAILNQIQEITKKYPIITVGIGAPSASSVTGNIEYAPNLKWRGIVPLKSIAKTAFNLPVAVTNDANAAGLGECAWGKCKGKNHVIMLTIGTGLGAAIIAEGRLIQGSGGFAGEFGHITAFPNGRQCGCGKKGCLEQYVSAQGIIKTYKELIPSTKVSSVKEVFDLANKNDTNAQKAVAITCEILGLHLANFINIMNPQAVCISGGVAKSSGEISKCLLPEIDKHILPIFKNKVEIIFSDSENQSVGVLGAAYLGFEYFLEL